MNMNRAATFELTLTRRIRAPRERVYAAFVEPQLMKKWMSPHGMTAAEASADARVGGKLRIVIESTDARFVAYGEYRELVPPERIVYTWNWEGAHAMPSETIVTVTLTERDGVTEVRMDHTGFVDEAIRDDHANGWAGCYDKLVEAFA